MSATNSRLRRWAVGCAATSTGSPANMLSNSARKPGLKPSARGQRNIGRNSGRKPNRRAGIGRNLSGAAQMLARQNRHCRTAAKVTTYVIGPGTCSGGSVSTDMKRPEAILIAGPTASGKSAWRSGSRKSSVASSSTPPDSMQVYRDLRIITARPSETEEASVPHALFGTEDGAENFSAGRWLAAAQREYKSAQAAGLIPIFVGGTGALLQGPDARPVGHPIGA